MADWTPMGFEPESATVAIEDILPMKQMSASVRKSRKYGQIAASIRKIGLVQPPVVARHDTLNDKYLLLDGHLRIDILKRLDIGEVDCLVSLDDEAFTYNRQVNRLATIQEHKMILRLIERGIPEELIAEALDVNVTTIRGKLSLLHGICPEAAELLKDKHCPINTIRELKKMKPLRQIEVAELMTAMNNYSVIYANALVASTPPDQLVSTAKPRMPKGVTPEQIEQIKRELAHLQRHIKQIEATYASDHLNLVLATAYVRSLLGNAAIDSYLQEHHPELREQLVGICDATALVSEAAE